MADTLTLSDPQAPELLGEPPISEGDLQPVQPEPSGPKRLSTFLHDVREEVKKVDTPTKDQVRQGTIVVVATVFIFAAYFELVDLILGKGIDKLLVWAVKH